MAITRTGDRIEVNLDVVRLRPVSVDDNGERWVEIFAGEFLAVEDEYRRVCSRNDGTWEAWKVDRETTVGCRQCSGAGIHETFEAAAAATV